MGRYTTCMQNKTVLWLFVGVVALVLFGFFVRRESTLPAATTPPMATTTNATSTSATASTTTTDLGNGITVTGPAGSRVVITPVSTNITVAKAPDLSHVVTYSADLPPDAVTAISKNIASDTASLKQNPAQGDVWLQLAVYYKIAGDYHAAEAVWLYMTKAAPTNAVAFGDLGDLYQNFLKDYPKAESNYLQAVQLDPKNIDLYRNLYTLYKYQYKTGTTAAADILVRGLKSNPNNPDLLALQKQ